MANILDIIPEWGSFVYCLVGENVPSEMIKEIQQYLLLDGTFNDMDKKDILEGVRNYLSQKLDIDTYLLIMGKIERDEIRLDKLNLGSNE